VRSPGSSDGTRYQVVTGDPAQLGEGVAKDWASKVALQAAANPIKMVAGFWRGGQGEKTVAVMVYGRQWVELKPTPMRVENGARVVLQGRLLVPNKSRVDGYINRGDFGYLRCTVDRRVEMPAFRITCPTSKADDLAYFQILAATKTSIMSDIVLEQLIWPSGKPSDTYRSPATRRALARAQAAVAKPAATAPQAAKSDAPRADDAPQIKPLPVAELPTGTRAKDYAARFIALLNKVRADADLAPVTLATKQSTSIEGLTAQFFNIYRGEDPQAANQIVLGILAGWEVDGSIIDATIGGDWVSGKRPVQLLEHMLEFPAGRLALMGPDASQIALGTIERNEGTGAVVASYTFVPDIHPNRRVARVIDALSEQRKTFGSRPAEEDAQLRAAARRIGTEIRAGNLEIIEARDELMDLALKRFRKPVRGYAFVAQSLEDVDFPRIMLTSKNLRVSVVATPFNKPGYPWTMYVILVVFPDQPDSDIARRQLKQNDADETSVAARLQAPLRRATQTDPKSHPHGV
jgi:hypothetical protein